MADEPETSPANEGDTFVQDTADETQEVAEGLEVELDDDGNPVPPEPEDEEVDFDGTKFKVPKTEAQKVKEALLRQADYTRKTQEVAEQRKAFEAERDTFHQASEQEVSARAQVVAYDQQIAEYNRLDWNALHESDPFEAQRHWMIFGQLEKARGVAAQQAQQLSFQRQSAAQQEIAKRVEEGRAVLARDIPDWSPQLAETLLDTGVKKYGFERAEIEEFSDPRMVKVLHDAHQYHALKAKNQKAQGHIEAQKVTPAAKVSGASAPPSGLDDRLSMDEWQRRRQAQVKKLA